MSLSAPPRPSDINGHIGGRLRTLRKQRRLSLQTVGDLLGVSAQQVSRFELGAHRISAEQLFSVAQALDTPISWFFAGFEMSAEFEDLVRWTVHEPVGDWTPTQTRPSDDENNLLVSFRLLTHKHHKKAVLQLVDALARD